IFYEKFKGKIINPEVVDRKVVHSALEISATEWIKHKFNDNDPDLRGLLKDIINLANCQEIYLLGIGNIGMVSSCLNQTDHIYLFRNHHSDDFKKIPLPMKGILYKDIPSLY